MSPKETPEPSETVLLRIALSMEHIAEKVDSMAETINGKNGSPGLVIRVDRLEQTAKANRRISWALVAGTIGLAFAAIRNALHI